MTTAVNHFYYKHYSYTKSQRAYLGTRISRMDRMFHYIIIHMIYESKISYLSLSVFFHLAAFQYIKYQSSIFGFINTILITMNPIV